MAKTITLRISDDTYQMLKTAANGTRRTISNFLEYAAVSFLSQDAFVSDREMDEIINDKSLLKSLKRGEKEVKEGRYRIVD